MDDITLGPFPGGINNRQPNHALPEGTLRNAVNARIDNSGHLSRRSGIALVYPGLNLRDGFDCPLGVLFREGSSIKRFNSDNTSTELFGGVVGNSCTFEYLNGVIYFSDGIITKKIDSNWNVTEWGIEPPVSPVLYGTYGSLGAGRYTACVTFVDGNGVESGSSDIVIVTIDDDNGIVFSAIPSPVDSQVVGIKLYLSTANGDVMYNVAEIPAGTSDYTVTSGGYDEGAALETQFLNKPPAGRIIREFNGRLYIADSVGNVWITEPLSYDQCRLSEGFLQFPQPVDVMEPVTDGIWFAYGERTDFYAGADIDLFNPVPIFQYGAVFGTGKKVQNSNNVMWYSNRGTILGSSSGQAQNLQEANVATQTADSGATVMKEEDGIRQFITSLDNPTVSNLAAKDFIDAEIIRKGE